MSRTQDSKRQHKGGRPRNESRYGWNAGALRLRRYALGLSAEDLAVRIAEATGGKVSRGAVGCWERGEHEPESPTVEAIAAIVGCEPWELGVPPVVMASGAAAAGDRSDSTREDEGVPTPARGGESIYYPDNMAGPHF